MKKFLLVFALVAVYAVSGQTLTLTKGKLLDSIPVNDSIPETFGLYLPKSFDVSKKWPVVFVFDMKGRAKQALGMLVQAAETEGYILAASNNVNDSLSITKNVLVSSRMLDKVNSILPLHDNRVYTAGFAAGGRLASVLPTFIKGIAGVLSFGAPINNLEVLSPKKPFHFIGVVGNEDYNYPAMLKSEKILNKMNFPNQLFVFEGGEQWPTTDYISIALQTFKLPNHWPVDS